MLFQPQRKRQQLRVVQMVKLAVERERRFIGVLRKGGQDTPERAGGLFAHADNVHAFVLPALAGGDERYIIPGAGKRNAFFMKYTRIVAVVYAGKVADSCLSHSFLPEV